MIAGPAGCWWRVEPGGVLGRAAVLQGGGRTGLSGARPAHHCPHSSVSRGARLFRTQPATTATTRPPPAWRASSGDSLTEG